MIIRLGCLLALMVLWVGALWWLIVPAFDQWSLAQWLAGHLAPPLFIWGGGVFWLHRRHLRMKKAEGARAERAEVDRLIERDEARQAHIRQLEQQRFHCDCRAVAFSRIVPPDQESDSWVPVSDQVSCLLSGACEDADAEATLFEHMQPGLFEAMQCIYQSIPAAAAFPIYIQPPAASSGDAVLRYVREMRAASMAEHGFISSSVVFEPALFLPDRGNAADSVLSVFEGNPDLPGALVLAFDSPKWCERNSEDGESSAELVESRQWRGRPTQGVTAMFLTSRTLPNIWAEMGLTDQGSQDAMTPFWARDELVGIHGFLAGLGEKSLSGLRSSAVLARIHRASSQDLGMQSLRGRKFARSLEILLERAQIQAALVTPPIPDDEEPAPSAISSVEAGSDYGWLIHNAGESDCGGHRLAALGSALYGRSIDLDPIAEATNATIRIGDLGAGRGLAMLGITVARVVESGLPCLCAEFGDLSGVALYFAVPADAASAG
ncbi:MAG: hypothetical protein D3M94_19395 [Rhodocyclales bacterium GT-UBC]|nr:MAG: hypothetical protein D3M94_19395 [Rhodocyclales bacterium GT-UBC]